MARAWGEAKLAAEIREAPRRCEETPRRVTVLGATGSVGRSTLDLLERNPGRFQVEALSAHRNVEALAASARKLGARLAVVADPARYQDLKAALAGSGIDCAAGDAAVVEAAGRPADIVMASIVGAAGLAPALATARQGTTLALANKEALVCAGGLLMAEVARCGGRILPVDSEHSAIFQVLDRRQDSAVEKLVLTASGGPFRSVSAERLAQVTAADALAHPTWDMGAKITIDSATMMNKGLELIEAHHLFEMAEGRIEVLVHPQSIVHSMVCYRDGSVLAQLGTPDMRTPIAVALAWPERMETPVESLDLARIGALTFEAPDVERFPALRLARESLRRGASAPTLLNAANEVGVAAFLERRIGFAAIAAVVEDTLERAEVHPLTCLDDVLAADATGRRIAKDRLAAYLR